MLNIVKLADLIDLQPRVLEDLIKALFGPLMLIFKNPRKTRKGQKWKKATVRPILKKGK